MGEDSIKLFLLMRFLFSLRQESSYNGMSVHKKIIISSRRHRTKPSLKAFQMAFSRWTGSGASPRLTGRPKRLPKLQAARPTAGSARKCSAPACAKPNARCGGPRKPAKRSAASQVTSLARKEPVFRSAYPPRSFGTARSRSSAGRFHVGDLASRSQRSTSGYG
jgi:hypothetical protein